MQILRVIQTGELIFLKNLITTTFRSIHSAVFFKCTIMIIWNDIFFPENDGKYQNY